jgi:SnoaL-like protein
MRLLYSGMTLCLLTGVFLGQPAPRGLPSLQKRPNARAVVDEHLDALNRCDWGRLLAQYPPEVEIFLPGGVVIKGREKVAELFRTLVKPVKEGGLCGIRIEAEHVFPVGRTLNVQWRATGDALAEAYRGADAFVTRDGLMWAQVTTFRREELKLK